MLLLMTLAFADDPDDLKSIATELDGVDALIERAEGWFSESSAEPEVVAVGESTKVELREASSRARELHRKLIAIKGRLAAGKKGDQELVPTAVGLMDRIKSQNPRRLAAISIVDVGLLMPRVAEDETALASVNNSLYTAMQNRPESTDIDLWMQRPLELAVSEERWNLVFSWGTWCELACTDKDFARKALDQVPEKHGKDARWLTLPATR